MYDRVLVWLTLFLCITGLIMVSSASISIGQDLYHDAFYFLKREIFYFLLMFFLSFLFLRIPIKFWKKNSNIILIITIFLLIIVLLAGISVNGSSRWIKIGIFSIQPSEICKISSFIYLSSYLSRKINEVRKCFWGFFKPMSVISVQSIFLLAEPDFGTVIILFVTSLSILFLSGAKIKQFLSFIIFIILIIIFLILDKPYRIKRMLSFWNPWQDPFGNGYQLTQSLMALGRGHFFGQGLGNSIQKLNYLPEAHSDFIFSIIGEELGYIGCFSILLIIFSMSFRAMYIGQKALKKQKNFSGFLACSIGFWFSFQTLINIGAATGILPTKGLTLPLISYGGSSLIINLIAICILLRIDFEMRIKKYQALPKEFFNEI